MRNEAEPVFGRRLFFKRAINVALSAGGIASAVDLGQQRSNSNSDHAVSRLETSSKGDHLKTTFESAVLIGSALSLGIQGLNWVDRRVARSRQGYSK